MTRTHTSSTILDGSPRYAHKTSQLLTKSANDSDTKGIVLTPNHQLAHEICTDHLTDDTYDPRPQRRVVHVQGKERSCPGCTHHPEGDEYYQIVQAAEEALTQHRIVTPEVFEGTGVCPYYATKEAAKRANWIVTVPHMLERLVDSLNFEEYDVIIDEESTMEWFWPKTGTLFTLENPAYDNDMMPLNVTLGEGSTFLHGNPIASVREWMDRKLEEYERVPGRYRVIQDAVDALAELKRKLVDVTDLEAYEDAEALSHVYPEVDVPHVDITEHSEREQSAAFTILRKELGRFAAAPFLEAILCDAQINVLGSGSGIDVFLNPDPTHEFLYHREVFESCANVYLVGDRIASEFAVKFMEPTEVAQSRESLGQVETDNLDIVVLVGDEMERRNAATQLSQGLIDNDIHNLLIAGSGVRAKQAYDRLHPNAYYFHGGADLTHYHTAAEADWSVVSYMGSRITRGIAVDTQVTICRSMQFASPRWLAHPVEEYGQEMMEYENIIELHNAMLRGAGQGEEHIAIIPQPLMLRYGLGDYVTEFSIDDLGAVIEFVMTKLGLVPEQTAISTYACDECGVEFATIHGYDEHICSAPQ